MGGREGGKGGIARGRGGGLTVWEDVEGMMMDGIVFWRRGP